MEFLQIVFVTFSIALIAALGLKIHNDNQKIESLQQQVNGIVARLRDERDIEIHDLQRKHVEIVESIHRYYRDEIEKIRKEYEHRLSEIRAQFEDRMTVLWDRLIVSKPIPASDVYRESTLIVIGPDPALMIDIAALRRAGVRFHRVTNVTKKSFEAAINRRRKTGQMYRFVVISSHAEENSIEFSDGAVDGDWLSNRMSGVECLIVLGCSASGIGDWVGGISDYVITFGEPVSASTNPVLNDVNIFIEQFFRLIDEDVSIFDAYYQALDKSPSWLSEIAEIHQ